MRWSLNRHLYAPNDQWKLYCSSVQHFGLIVKSHMLHGCLWHKWESQILTIKILVCASVRQYRNFWYSALFELIPHPNPSPITPEGRDRSTIDSKSKSHILTIKTLVCASVRQYRNFSTGINSVLFELIPHNNPNPNPYYIRGQSQ